MSPNYGVRFHDMVADRRYVAPERRRVRRIEVRVNENEYRRIVRNADHDGMSVSEYLRRRGLRNE